MKPAQLVDFVLRHGRLRTYHCSRQHFNDGEFRTHPRTLNDWNLIFVTRGRPRWRIGDRWHELRPQTLLASPPRVQHEAHTGDTKRVTLLSLHVNLTLPGGQDALELLATPQVRPVEARSRLDGYLRQALSEFDRDDAAHTAQAMPAWCRLVVHEMLRADLRAGRLSAAPLDPLVTKLLERLAAAYGQPITLDDLEAWSGYSRQHVNRVFNRVLGVTPIKLLARMRMDRAASLLVTTNHTIAQVGEAVGFVDPYHFSRAFSRHAGMSPTAYRRSYSSEYPSSDSSPPLA